MLHLHLQSLHTEVLSGNLHKGQGQALTDDQGKWVPRPASIGQCRARLV